jgi:ribosomal protein S18 acetylase RimI-like enzyme
MFVRTASDRDIPAIRALLVETWHDTYDRIYGAARVTEITDDWHSIASLTGRLTRPRSEYLVADDGERIAGMAFAVADEGGDTVTLHQLYVTPGLQGGGIGGLLLDEIEDSFPQAKRFVLEVEAANEKAVRFYLSRGFVDMGPSKGACTRDGVSSTAREMVLSRV